MTDQPRRRIDATSLRGLAHPLRMRLLDELRSNGPATSARLAERLGENTGTVSWHLRHLAEHGFIEEEADRGTRRERWWRAVRSCNVLNTADFERDPATKGALDVYVGELLREQFRRVADAMAAELPEEWRGVGTVSGWSNLRLTPGQLRALNDELMAVIDRHTPDPDAEPDPTARPVIVQIQSLPRKESDPT
ncbi:helix-turn-helix domain-containing protein [Streptomyces sp. SP17BM10]|uniref:helix-turn-helix domain-containing protein n=1 Tax=Streptomyces sp. SP17BM10 TaxID=3002530 RepID=UPI002E764A24|nr:helix-turn-helix domain-containing protein [Streptomyces sp. SP17BM10]MEE1783504.1 helix-turn-helix domain-containing protein [Streptomyces sp. SP17BM10]